MKETPVKSNSRLAMQYRGVECLNCGHPLDLSDRFCAYCGQLNTTKRLTLKDFFNEFILSVFTYDSRFRHTLKDILLKPGTITRNYVEGKRLRYANPFRFFLSASIFYFILIGVIALFQDNDDLDFNGNAFVVGDSKGNVIDVDDLDVDLDALQNVTNENELQEVIESQVEASVAKAKERAALEAQQDSIRTAEGADASKKAAYSYTYVAEDSIAHKHWIKRIATKFELFRDFYLTTEIRDSDIALDSLKYERTKTNLWLYSKNNDIKRVEEDPQRFVRYLSAKIPFFIFFFAPFYALFFWLIYAKKKFNYMEHLVFIFHIFSWVFVVLLLALIPDTIFFQDEEVITAILLMLVGPFYFYKALRNFYKQGRFITIIKFVFLNFVFFIGTTVFALIFFAITAVFF